MEKGACDRKKHNPEFPDCAAVRCRQSSLQMIGELLILSEKMHNLLLIVKLHKDSSHETQNGG